MSNIARFDFARFAYSIENHDVQAKQLKPTSNSINQRLQANLSALEQEASSIDLALLVSDQSTHYGIQHHVHTTT